MKYCFAIVQINLIRYMHVVCTHLRISFTIESNLISLSLINTKTNFVLVPKNVNHNT